MVPSVNVLLSYDIYVTPYSDGIGVKSVHDKLVSSPVYVAYCHDDVLVQLADLLYCDVHRELPNFVMANFGLMFGLDADEIIINLINQELIKISTNQGFNHYITNAFDDLYKDEFCENQYSHEQIQFNDMKELWYIFTGFLFLSIVANFYTKWVEWRKRRQVVKPEIKEGNMTRATREEKETMGTARRLIFHTSIELGTKDKFEILRRNVTEEKSIGEENMEKRARRRVKLEVEETRGSVEYPCNIDKVTKDITKIANDIITNNLNIFENELLDQISSIWDLLFEPPTRPPFPTLSNKVIKKLSILLPQRLPKSRSILSPKSPHKYIYTSLLTSVKLEESLDTSPKSPLLEILHSDTYREPSLQYELVEYEPELPQFTVHMQSTNLQPLISS